MPPLAKSAVGDLDHFTGDIRSHLFSINPDPNAAQFNDDGSLSSPFITLSYACKQCHDGEMATDLDLEALSVMADGYHTPPLPTPEPPPTPEPVIVVVDAAQGEVLFQDTCALCHGTDAKGIPDLGKDLTTSAFAQDLSDEELVSFISTGRPTDDPLNTTGEEMPPRGGNSDLSDSDLLDIVAYIRTLAE
jgi:mono/diheme cytochrome c family protein